MFARDQIGASFQEESDLLHTSRKSLFHHWKPRFLQGMKLRRSHCVICIQIQQITNLPSDIEGRALVVGWKTKGTQGEHTNPVCVTQGNASFDEIFLHYCGIEGGSSLRNFLIWVSLVDSADCDLGTFRVDLSELANAESSNSGLNSSAHIGSNPRFGGRGMSFMLGGIANGGVLNLSVYCRMMAKDSHDVADGRKNERKGSCLSCLPDLSCLRAPSALAKRIPSLRSERDRGGFITIENSIHDDSIRVEEDEDGDYITIEKGTISASSRSVRPPSDNLANTTDDDEDINGHEDEKACLMMELQEDFDVEKVEDEFLTMLEDKYWKKGHEVMMIEPWRREIEESLNASLDLSLDLDLNLDALIKEAEIELAKAAQAWKSKVGAAVMEKEEYEDLVKRWSSKENICKGYNNLAFGFGSPI